MYPRQEADPWARPGRYINTQETPEQLEGVTRSTRSIPDHALGSGWQPTELVADYDNGGILTVFVATDVQPSDGSVDPFTNATRGDDNILLSGAPALRADEDFMVASIDDGDTIRGSLDGTPGSFSCANAEGCVFISDHWDENFYARSTGVTFTPDGGSARPVTRHEWNAPAADYLAFGHWLYVPEDVTDAVNYDFGVFASGGDPFEVSNLAGLTGTATYEGDAVGMYYVNGLSANPDVGSFTAGVTLEADFGDSSATGFISGEVNNFMFEGDVASSLPATVSLTSNAYDYVYEGFGVLQGSTNIFDTTWSGDPAPFPGGHVAGSTEANVDGEDWYGEWHAVFYGNGASATDHPTSVGGVFRISPYDDNNRVGSGLTGSIGAHRQ